MFFLHTKDTQYYYSDDDDVSKLSTKTIALLFDLYYVLSPMNEELILFCIFGFIKRRIFNIPVTNKHKLIFAMIINSVYCRLIQSV